MAHTETQTEWEETMARRVMEQIRSELYLDQRYLNAALGALPPAPLRSTQKALATDGAHLYYPPEWVLQLYRKKPPLPAPSLPAQPVPLHFAASLAAGPPGPRPVGPCLRHYGGASAGFPGHPRHHPAGGLAAAADLRPAAVGMQAAGRRAGLPGAGCHRRRHPAEIPAGIYQ